MTAQKRNTNRKRNANTSFQRKKRNVKQDNLKQLIKHPRKLAALLILILAAYLADPALLKNVLHDFLPDTFTEFQVNSSSSAENNSQKVSGELQIDFLDVGQGLSVLAKADGDFLLYDGGDRSSSSFVVSYLKEQGIDTLDYVIASHYDSDHLNGLVGALNSFDVEEILGPDYSTDTRVYHSFISKAEELEIDIETPEPGSRYPFGEGYFEVLAPLSDDYSDVNNYSIVIRLVYGETSILLTGDAEIESEAEMLAAGEMLDSTLLCVGHHGSPSSSSQEFLEAVSPEYAVISCGKDNSYGHPDRSVLERLDALQIPVWRTDEVGTISVRGDGKSLFFSQEKASS